VTIRLVCARCRGPVDKADPFNCGQCHIAGMCLDCAADHTLNHMMEDLERAEREDFAKTTRECFAGFST
jgi:hypothetical protein